MVNSPFFTRRAARFAELVDGTVRGPGLGKTPSRDALFRDATPGHVTAGRSRHRPRSRREQEDRVLVALTDHVARLPIEADPAEDFRGGLRAMLVATMERESAIAADRAEATVPLGALAGRPQGVRRLPTAGTGRTRAAVLVGVTAGALALSGVSAASTDSVPGDPLYQVKRSSERAQLALAGSDQSRGQLYLEFAHARLFEAKRVGADKLGDALAEMDRETIDGVRLLTAVAVQHGDPTMLDALASFVDNQRSQLDEMHQTLTVAGVEPMRRSFALLDAIALRAKTLTTALTRGCEILPNVDDLGPAPATC